MTVKVSPALSTKPLLARPVLILWCDPQALGAARLLMRLETSYALQSISKLDLVEAAATANPDSPVLLLIRKPADWIYDRLVGGADPDQALALWLEEARQLQNLLHRFRRRILLQDVQGALLAPDVFFDSFDQDIPATEEPEQPDVAPTRDPMLWLLAEQSVLRSPEANLLAGELDAAIPARADHGSDQGAEDPGSLNGLYQALLAQRQEALESAAPAEGPGRDPAEAAREAAQIAELQGLVAQQAQHIDSLRNTLAHQEDLADHANNRFSQQQAYLTSLEELLEQQKAHVADQRSHIETQTSLLAQSTQALEAKEGELADLQKQADSAKQRNGALQLQIRSQLEEMRLLHDETAHKQQRITDLEGEMHRVMTSHSIRLTEPLRALRRLLARG